MSQKLTNMLNTHIDNLLKQECGPNKDSVAWGLNEISHIMHCLDNLSKMEDQFIKLAEENKKLLSEIQTYRDKEYNQKEVSEKVADS